MPTEAFDTGHSIGKKDTDGLWAILFFDSSYSPCGENWDEFSKGFLSGQVETGKESQSVQADILKFAQDWIKSEQRQKAATAFMEQQNYPLA